MQPMPGLFPSPLPSYKDRTGDGGNAKRRLPLQGGRKVASFLGSSLCAIRPFLCH